MSHRVPFAAFFFLVAVVIFWELTRGLVCVVATSCCVIVGLAEVEMALTLLWQQGPFFCSCGFGMTRIETRLAEIRLRSDAFGEISRALVTVVFLPVMSSVPSPSSFPVPLRHRCQHFLHHSYHTSYVNSLHQNFLLEKNLLSGKHRHRLLPTRYH